MKTERARVRQGRYLGATLVGLLLTLGGCTMGPDYKRPEVRLPTQFSGQAAEQTATDPSSEVSSQWWVLFNDPGLVRLVNLALEHNTDLLQAAARIEQADAVVAQSRAARIPQVGLTADASRSRSSETAAQSFGGTSNNIRIAASTAFELDLWGRLRRASESARAQLLATRYAHEVVRQTVAGMVARSYFSLLTLDRQITLSRDILQSRVEELRLQKLRAEHGVIGQLDQEQSETLRAEAALQLRELERQRALQATQLGLLTGQPGIAIPDSKSVRLAMPPVPPAGVPSRLLERRPDVSQAEQFLISTNAQIGVAKAEMFPKLSLTTLAGAESADLATLIRSGSRIWTLGFGLGLPFFDAGQRLAVTEQAKARQIEALAAYQGAVQSAFKDVADALTNLQAARASQADVEARERAALNALYLAQKRYASGYSGMLEQLEAQRTANLVQLQTLSTMEAQYSATVDMFKALGGGWDLTQ